MQKREKSEFKFICITTFSQLKTVQYEHQVMNHPADCARRSVRQEAHCLTRYMVDRGDKLAR